MMDGFRDVIVRKIFTNTSVLASTTSDSESFDLGEMTSFGDMSLYLDIATGQGDFVYLLSPDDKTFVQASTGTTIAANFSATDGVAADGKDMISFSPEIARFIKIRVHGGATAGVTITEAFLLGH